MTVEELRNYQANNQRKFPLLHLIPKGLSLSDLKLNKVKRESISGFENDCWRFLADVIVLTAGSPYGRYMSVDVFLLYTRRIISVFPWENHTNRVNQISALLGGGSLALIMIFLICLLLLYKFRQHVMLGASHFRMPEEVSSCQKTLNENYKRFTRRIRHGKLLTAFFLTTLYIPISKFAVDVIIWNHDLSPEEATCYSTTQTDGFNWVLISMVSLT